MNPNYQVFTLLKNMLFEILIKRIISVFRSIKQPIHNARFGSSLDLVQLHGSSFGLLKGILPSIFNFFIVCIFKSGSLNQRLDHLIRRWAASVLL